MDQHFILHEDLLNFQPLHTTHTGRHIAYDIFDSLCEFGIQNKLFCITTDNASNNYKMIKELSFLLRDNDCILWPGDSRHIPCLAHVLNLALQAFLNKLNIAPMTEKRSGCSKVPMKMTMMTTTTVTHTGDYNPNELHRPAVPHLKADLDKLSPNYARSPKPSTFLQVVLKISTIIVNLNVF